MDSNKTIKKKRIITWGDKISKAKKGNSPSWCKGLTKETHPSLANSGRLTSERMKKNKKWNMENNPKWKGGVKEVNLRYRYIKSPGHPKGDKSDYVAEHRLIIEKEIGRYLKSTEKIHHINLQRKDNHRSNLYYCKDEKEHKRLHTQLNSLLEDIVKLKIIKFDGKDYYIDNEMLNITGLDNLSER